MDFVTETVKNGLYNMDCINTSFIRVAPQIQKQLRRGSEVRGEGPSPSQCPQHNSHYQYWEK